MYDVVDGCWWMLLVYGCVWYQWYHEISSLSPTEIQYLAVLSLAYLVQPTDTDVELGDPFLQSKYLGEHPYCWWLKPQKRPWKTPWHHKSLSDKQTELSKSNEIPEKDIQIWKLHQIAAKPPFSIAVAGSARVRISKGGWDASPVGKWFLLASCLRRLLAETWRCWTYMGHIWFINTMNIRYPLVI